MISYPVQNNAPSVLFPPQFRARLSDKPEQHCYRGKTDRSGFAAGISTYIHHYLIRDGWRMPIYFVLLEYMRTLYHSNAVVVFTYGYRWQLYPETVPSECQKCN